ncbi:dihydrodipicolinate synthase family protein [Pigmentiphaga sp. CHJ604]|uniref:dihydrodipicolinate synthase family protein n=1 Tax=Pigmentiphaga sp. CHJ604 TaxID=3081984 RepID=UPI0030D13968
MTRRQGRARLTAADIQGAWAIMPTPAKPDAADWRASDTVDIDEAVRAVESLIAGGIDGILTLGTFGEGATLDWEEKRAFLGAMVETVRGRVPFFGGTTSLNTRDTVRQTRAALDIGVDGTMLGLPMWCKPDLPTAVRFYRDVAEACPDMPICIYANVEAFKFEFSRAFWAQVADIPQVVSAKYLTIAQLFTDLKLTQGRIRFLTTDGDHYAAARIDPEQCTAFWSSGASCGPAPAIRLRDEVRQARGTGDWSAARQVADDIKASLSTLFPKGDVAEFAKYNIGLEKARIDAAGWMKAGPCRPPYMLVPEDYLAGARRSGEAWAALDRRYRQERQS